MVTTPSWLPAALTKIHTLVRQGQVLFTLKALRELTALGLGLDEQDACDVLAALSSTDFRGRKRSSSTGEWLYIFKAKVGGTFLYVKVILRLNCIVISFHEDNDETDSF